jgi:hypothetical protein
MAAVQLVDWAGSEVLYAHGQAHMGNASSSLRWRGNELFRAAVFRDGLLAVRVEGRAQLWDDVYNVSGFLDYEDPFEAMQVTGMVNDMSLLASYDLMSEMRGGWVLVELTGWTGDEVLLVDGRSRTSSNASALVRWRGHKVLSFSRSLKPRDAIEDALPSSYIDLDDFVVADDDIPSDCAVVDRDLPDFDLEEYTRASWYVQQQQVNPYQSRRELFCVVATYDANQEYSSTLYVPPGNFGPIGVYNYANEGEVNSDARTPPALCGRETNRAGRLLVSPCYLPNAFAGPYWVLDIGKYDDGSYQWAIVSGGQPRELQPDGMCTTGEWGSGC